MMRRLTLLATLLASLLAATHASSCLSESNCVDCTGNYTGHWCLNGGACSTGAVGEKSHRVCQCTSDYTGSDCAKEVNRCGGGFFCDNGGTCKTSGTPGCDCPLGYSGIRCDTVDVAETCTSVALSDEVCLHGGTCVGIERTKPCDCRYNHAGKNCEITDVVKCDDDGEVYCQNDGRCNSANTGCVCAQYFMGTTCGEVNYAALNDKGGSDADAVNVAAAVAVPFVLVLTCAFGFMAYMVRKEKQGKPLFVKAPEQDVSNVEMAGGAGPRV